MNHFCPDRVQVIHNSPDVLTDTVDVYLGSTLLLNDFAFRTASPFIDAPAENPIRVSFAPKTSTSVADTLAGLSFDFNLDANETYVIVAEGLVSTSGYAPLQSFNLKTLLNNHYLIWAHPSAKSSGSGYHS